MKAKNTYLRPVDHIKKWAELSSLAGRLVALSIILLEVLY